MKKLMVFAFLFLIVATFAYAGPWKNYEDFQAYKTARAAAQEAEGTGDTGTAVMNYKKAAELAGKSGTIEFQGWQLNNGAFVLIKKFKETVGYDDNGNLEFIKWVASFTSDNINGNGAEARTPEETTKEDTTADTNTAVKAVKKAVKKVVTKVETKVETKADTTTAAKTEPAKDATAILIKPVVPK
jgi:hypothetical protein